MTTVVHPFPNSRGSLRNALQASVRELRMQAALNLGARGEQEGDRISRACVAVCADYGADRLPDPAHISTIRDAVRELQQLIAQYGASGIPPADPLPNTLTGMG